MAPESAIVNHTFAISLRLRHPALSARQITRSMRSAPRASWSVGEPMRHHPALRKHSYWCHCLELSSSATLAESLAEDVRKLRERRVFLEEFSRSGGTIEYFIGWFATPAARGDLLPWG